MTEPTIELINRLKEGTDMVEAKPIWINPTALQDFIVTALRYLATIITGTMAIIGLLSRGDLAGLIAYVQSTEGLALISAVVAVGLGGWGAWKAYSNKQHLVAVGSAAPNDVAVVATRKEAKELGIK